MGIDQEGVIAQGPILASASSAADREYGQAPALLPVLDLQAGIVVHARQGQRSRYAPVSSALVAGSDPQQVLAALLDRTGAQRWYLADLDAIQGGRLQSALIARLLAAQPRAQLWLDAGFQSLAQAQTQIRAQILTQMQMQTQAQALTGMGRQAPPPVPTQRMTGARADAPASRSAASRSAAPWPALRPVLGTESLSSLEDLSCADCVLSLDFGAEGFRGDPSWLTHPECWPAELIVMPLERVGAQQGPDLAGLARCLRQAPTRRVYAAGGVRSREDLRQLAALGVHGALLATALHAGVLP